MPAENRYYVRRYGPRGGVDSVLPGAVTVGVMHPTGNIELQSRVIGSGEEAVSIQASGQLHLAPQASNVVRVHCDGRHPGAAFPPVMESDEQQQRLQNALEYVSALSALASALRQSGRVVNTKEDREIAANILSGAVRAIGEALDDEVGRF